MKVLQLTALVLVFLLLVCVPAYLGSRTDGAGPSTLESVVARIWIWFRRILGIGLGVAFIFGAVYKAAYENQSGSSSSWEATLVLLLFGVFLCLFGFFGATGKGLGALQDTIKSDKANKRRYKLWF